LKNAGWLLDAGTEYERAISGSGYSPSMGGMTAEPLVLRSDATAEIERLRDELATKDGRIARIVQSNREREAELRSYAK